MCILGKCFFVKLHLVGPGKILLTIQGGCSDFEPYIYQCDFTFENIVFSLKTISSSSLASNGKVKTP